jgi:hypothetical protein
MELQNTKKNTTTLTLDNDCINKLLLNTEKNKSNPLLLQQRTKRVHLLKQLLDCKTPITFSNEDNEVRFWLDQNNIAMIKSMLNDKLLRLISYRPAFQRKVIIAHTSEPLGISLQIDNSLLHCTFTQPLNLTTLRVFEKFLNEYDKINAKSIVASVINTHRKIHTIPQVITPKQDTPTPELQSIQLSEEEYDLFTALPYNTQQLIMDILDEK